jgi:hypothetical protein
LEQHIIEAIAGFGSSLIFILSNFPMVAKAIRTRNLKSYSFGQILMANGGNLLYWLYVSGLPIGPIWFLHGFNTAVAVLMLTLYIRFELRPGLVITRRFTSLKGA